MTRNGFSLVELMVALLLGSLISIAATQLFLVNRQSDNLQQGLSSIQDQGRFIFDYLSRDLMQAGYDGLAAIEPFEFNPAKGAGRYSIDGARNDELVVQMNAGFSCNGGFRDAPMIKRYHVNSDRNLVCAERYRDPADSVWKNSDSEVLIDNVEAFQVLYGLDFDTTLGQSGYGYADAYVDSSGVRLSRDGASPLPQRIVSVRFAVLLSSDKSAGLDPAKAPASISLLDQVIDSNDGVALNDGRLYRVYTSTVALRNQVEL